MTDIELLENFNNLRNDVLAEIYTRYSHLIYGVCLKYLECDEESLDTVVEIFESLFFKIPDNNITNFKSWLYSVTKNHCLMKLRKNKKYKNAIDNHFTETSYNNITEHNENEIMLNEKIQIAINKLNKEQKICIEMFYYQNKSYFDISEITGYSVKSVKSHLQNGKIKLKKIIENQL
jgi:RNA polymerase sigma-70 factor (ECF subfamily)